MDAPNQPPGSSIPKQNLGERKLSFQDHWYSLHPWLHFCTARGKMLCFYCARASELGTVGGAARETAFTVDGFNNWKKALQRFAQHARSEQHLANLPVSSRPITEVIETADAKQQKVNRVSLLHLITSIMYLAKRGMAFRGHESSDGNYVELVELRATDCAELEEWMRRKERFLHSDIQNELLKLISNEVLRDIISDMRDNSPDGSPSVLHFSVIVDGTQDIQGVEQESICVRYVDRDFKVHEEFMGFYRAHSTTGADLALLIQDALQRLGLPLDRLRGLAFDGAPNMAGSIRGAQAIRREKQPKALVVHCGAHCVNLVAKDGCDASKLIRNALYSIHEVGCLFSESHNFR